MEAGGLYGSLGVRRAGGTSGPRSQEEGEKVVPEPPDELAKLPDSGLALLRRAPANKTSGHWQ